MSPREAHAPAARVALIPSTASDHRPSCNVSGTAVRDRDPPVRYFFPKKLEMFFRKIRNARAFSNATPETLRAKR